jgi:hypothetical protein
MLLVVAVAVAFWLVIFRWGTILVWLRADLILVPLGVAIESPHEVSSVAFTGAGEIDPDWFARGRATWFSESCAICHAGPEDARIAFPPMRP